MAIATREALRAARMAIATREALRAARMAIAIRRAPRAPRMAIAIRRAPRAPRMAIAIQEGSEGSQDGDSDQEGSHGSQDGDSDQEGSGAGAGGIDDDAGLNASPSIDDIAADKGAEDILSAYDLHTLKRTCLNNFRRANYRTRDGINEAWVVDRIKNRIPRPALLADSVSRLVLSEARNTNDRYLSSGRFDRRAIGRASWGASNVFARKAYAPGIETAVFLLVDGSDSMRADARMVDAQSLAYHLGQAIDDAGAQCAIGAFYAGGREINASIRYRHRDGQRLARTCRPWPYRRANPGWHHAAIGRDHRRERITRHTGRRPTHMPAAHRWPVRSRSRRRARCLRHRRDDGC